MIKTRQHSGFTLVELVIAMVLTSMIMVGMGIVIKASFVGRIDTEAQSDLQLTGQTVASRIARDVRTSASASFSSNTLTLIPTDTSTYAQITYSLSGSAMVMRLTSSATGSVTSVVLLGGTDDPVTCNSFDAVLRSRTIMEDHDDDSDTAEISVTYTTLVAITLQLSCDGKTSEVSASSTLRRNVLKVRNASGL